MTTAGQVPGSTSAGSTAVPGSAGPLRFESQLVALCDELRAEGLSVGTSELLDAIAALGLVDWAREADFHEALAATLAKSADERRLFDLVFERFCFRAGEAQALITEAKESPSPRPGSATERFDLDELRAKIAQAIAEGDEAALRDLARLAISAFGKNQGSGVIGVDVQRIRRAIGLRTQPQPELPNDDPRHEGFTREQLQKFEAELRRELERAQIARDRKLPEKRPLSDLARGLPATPVQDLAAVHRVVSQMRRRLSTEGHETRGVRRHAHIDVRATLRASLQTGGVPVELRYRPVRPRRPEIYVLCDVSTSVTSASTFFLSVLHALHDVFRKLRSFVFIERISEVTTIFDHERDFHRASERIASDAGVADISGYTDYGRVWQDFLTQIEGELDRRSTVIVLGDARTNGRDPGTATFAAVTELAGRTFWLNPEPRLYWNYGDSMISAYEPYCEVFECARTDQLEEFVKALARPNRPGSR